MNKEWEDYEEPKEYYFIRDDGSGVGYSPIGNSTVAKRREEIGNYFETKEKAEKAVEKLKAWKRCGISFEGWEYTNVEGMIDGINIKIKAMDFNLRSKKVDLDLLFGGEE